MNADWLLTADPDAARRYLPGDVAAVLVFVTLGEFQHGVLPGMPLRAAATAALFLAGWALAAPVLGAYASRTLVSPRAAVLGAGVSWVAAALVGVGLRGLDAVPGDAHPVFLAVSIAVGGLLLVVWRGIVAALLD